jgi:hypothetical protein
MSLDATQCDIVFPGDATVTVTKEVGIDIATCTILGDALEREENSQGVERVLIQARKECESILAVLSDNGSANRAERIQVRLERECEVGQIFSFPCHPRTNGHIEGFFGQFSRIVGTIDIDDTSRESTARSVFEVVFRIYAHFHNHSARKRLGGLSPLEYLRRYSPSTEEQARARKGLKNRQERSRELRRKHARLSDERFRSLVGRAIERNRLDIPLEEALGALVRYDNQVIESSANALFVQSQRDGFEETKRTFAYFMGIVKRKQKDLDEDRLRTKIDGEKSRRLSQEARKAEEQLQREKAAEERKLKTNPEELILQYSDLLLRGRFRFLRESSLAALRRALEALADLGCAQRRVIERLSATIRNWGAYGEELKCDMVKLLWAEFETLGAPRGSGYG